MSKNAKFLPMTHNVHTSWIAHADIGWSGWEARVAGEIGTTDFQFSDEYKMRIGDALNLMTRSKSPVVKIEDAKKIVRNIKARFEKMNLPDHHLLRPGNPCEPSDFLMNLGFEGVTDIFREAMLNTLDDARDGRNVTQRLGKYLSLLRKSECALEGPRSEAMAAYLIKEVFESCGIPAKVTHTRPTAYGEGNEKISTFEAFVFEHIMPEIGSDHAARETLRRRLNEAKRAMGFSR